MTKFDDNYFAFDSSTSICISVGVYMCAIMLYSIAQYL